MYISASFPKQLGGHVEEVQTAEFQADSLITGAYLSNKRDTSSSEYIIIMSDDADFSGFCDDDCLQLKKYTGKEVTAAYTSTKTMQKAMQCLRPVSKKKVELHTPDYPIFEGIQLLDLRALLGVVIGCDVSPGGVPDCGPAAVQDELNLIKARAALLCTELKGRL